MSFATRCPACGTTFKVASEELALADGWVRCGRCSEIFDGAESRYELDLHAATPAEQDAREDSQRAEEAEAAKAGGGPVHAAVRNGDLWGGLPSLDLERPAASPPAAAAAPALALPDISSASPVSVFEGLVSTGPTDTPERPDGSRAGLPRGVVQAASEPVADFAADSPFHIGTEGKPAGRGKGGRFLRRALMVLALLLVLLFAAQVVYRQRDAIAAHLPSLSPALAAMCSVAGCEISALRRPDDVVIDSASFARAPEAHRGYRLDFTLRNRADVPLTMPAIELSLLDTQDRPVIRRVLLPADFGAPGVLMARAEHSAAMSLAVADPGSAFRSEADTWPRIAGYAVVAFHP